MATIEKTEITWIVPLLMGVLTCLTVTGFRVLDPTNIAWLGQGDPVIHYLGWAFFRDTPWLFPLGSNPHYGLEIANSIVYSDSIPLLAFLFKPWALDPFLFCPSILV